MLAMGQDPSEIPARVPRDWRGRTASDIMREIIGETFETSFQTRIIESALIPPDMVLMVSLDHGVKVWPPEEQRTIHFAPTLDAGSKWFDRQSMAFLAAERIAMSIPRTYGVTVKSTTPTIGRPPRKSRGLTGRRYRAARRDYARKRRAWVRAGSPTYATAFHMPSVLVGIDVSS